MIQLKLAEILSVFITVLLIAGTALCNRSANQYIENLLSEPFAKELKAQDLDPAPLPDFRTEFEDKVLFIGRVKGHADFHHGKFTGLSDARRRSVCEGSRGSDENSGSVRCSISFDHLKIYYDGVLKYGVMPKVTIHGHGRLSRTIAELEIVHNPPLSPVVQTLSITQLGNLQNVKFTGLGPLNRFTGVLVEGFKERAQTDVYNIVSLKLQYVLNNAASQLPFPLF